MNQLHFLVLNILYWGDLMKKTRKNRLTRFTLLSFLERQWGSPGGSDGKESACNAGDPGSTPGSGRFPGEGKGNPLQYSCLDNPMDRGAWQRTVHRVTKSQTWLSMHVSIITFLCVHRVHTLVTRAKGNLPPTPHSCRFYVFAHIVSLPSLHGQVILILQGSVQEILPSLSSWQN